MRRAPSAARDSTDQAIAAVDALLLDPDSDPGYEPEDSAGARAAIARFAERFGSAEGWVRKALSGARAGARGLSGDPLQGLSEIVQNADDTGAKYVRVSLTTNALLAAHDGRPVILSDVFALATPWVTTKGEDASATGRFGIGLQTLQTLSATLEIASGHYRMRLADTISAVDEVPVPDGFAGDGDTLFRVPLEPGVLDAPAIDAWFASWDDAALLFCKSVRRITLQAGNQVLRTLQITFAARPDGSATIAAENVTTRRRVARSSDGRRWSVHTAAIRRPPGVHRTRKAMDRLTPLGVALPLHAEDRGQLYAGLPVVGTRSAARINAQFDPLTGRQGLAPESPWNLALCPLVADMWVGAVLDLFDTHPADGWRVLPLDPPAEDPKHSIVANIEGRLLEAARTILPARLRFDVTGQAVPLSELAVEAPRLQEIVTGAEVAELAHLRAALPAAARDPDNRWRDVLADWRAAGAALPDPLTVELALGLFNLPSRSPEATVALAAAALDEGLDDELAAYPSVVTTDGTHIRPPAPSDPWLLAQEPGGLAGALGLARPLHPAYSANTPDAVAVVGWLRQQGAFGDPADARSVLRRLVAAGDSGRRLPEALSDEQLRALRDIFESLEMSERAEFGSGVGKAIVIEVFEHGPRGRRILKTASPAETYLPRAIDKEPDSFAVAAARAPGIEWAHWRYANSLRSPLGRAGLGAQRFLRLLGAETAPRLVPHPDLFNRYIDPRRGLSNIVGGNPPGRVQAMSGMGATYTLEDRHSPDLAAVLTDIGRDRRAARRRARATAMLATLGRAWDRLADLAEVQAAIDFYAWTPKGTTRAFWVWQAATIPWLDDNTSTARPPAELRLRTPSTVAVHGANAPGYIHRDTPILRQDVLAALGVAGEPSTGDLVKRLRQLRDSPPDPGTEATDAALAYQGLADRLAGRAHVPGDLGRPQLTSAFSDGVGLVRTNLGWRQPLEVLLGPPVFGDRRPFVPAVPGADRLWTVLRIRRPSLDDCIRVLGELGRSQSAPSVVDQTTMLETLRLLESLLAEASPSSALRRRLAQLPLWTTKGWRTTRPLYAVEDPTLAGGLAPLVAVWLPGGDLAQFPQLLRHLRLTEMAAESTTVVDADRATRDEDATALMEAAVELLREDLARNDPASESALEIGWNRLAEFEVRVARELSVRVGGVDGDGLTVSVSAKAEPDAAVLFLRDPTLLARVDAGGRAIAGLFAADRRSVAQAWLAACDGAQAGREAQRIQLARERAAEEEARAQVAIASQLATFRLQTEAAHARAPARRTERTTASPGGGPVSVHPAPASSHRVLVDPSTLRMADVRGTLVGFDGKRSPGAVMRRAGESPKELPAPRAGGAELRSTATPAAYTPGSKEAVGLDLVRMVLASDAADMRDLRAQHGVGADAVDALERFFELKVYAGEEPERITLEESQIRRAMSTPSFFLVVVSRVEGEKATPRVRVIVDPLHQLVMTETSSVSFAGVRNSQSLVYEFVRDEVQGT